MSHRGKNRKRFRTTEQPVIIRRTFSVTLKVFVLCIILFLTMTLAYAGGTIFRISTGLAEESEEFFQRQPQPAPAVASTTVRVPILIYHSVRPDYLNVTREQRQFSVSPEMFDTQLTYLHDNGFTVISMDELVRDLKAGTTGTTSKPVVITFDDGWENQYKHAFPILKAHGYKALFYVFTNPIMHDNPHYLSWDQLREMRDAGMEIGSHTLSHPYLSKLTDEQLQHEVVASKMIIESHLGIPVHHFASPFGFTSPALERLIKAAGYETGRTTYRGSVHAEGDEPRLTGFLMSNDMATFKNIVDTSE